MPKLADNFDDLDDNALTAEILSVLDDPAEAGYLAKLRDERKRRLVINPLPFMAGDFLGAVLYAPGSVDHMRELFVGMMEDHGMSAPVALAKLEVTLNTGILSCDDLALMETYEQAKHDLAEVYRVFTQSWSKGRTLVICDGERATTYYANREALVREGGGEGLSGHPWYASIEDKGSCIDARVPDGYFRTMRLCHAAIREHHEAVLRNSK